MQAATIEKRIGSLPNLSRSDRRINGLHRLMRSVHLYERAYVKISRNAGALTPGIDGETFDGMSLEKIAGLARRVADGTYRPCPVRRVHIPKANGKTRPLGIPTIEDRLVQEVARTILEAIYEPVFLDQSHGFRPRRSCHTALELIQNTWTGCKWLVKVDVRGFFDNINHEVLIRLLERRIEDHRFIDLIKGMLTAGCLDEWVFERTYTGTPQGGIISPLIANIYLHEFDLLMEKMRADFDRGARRKPNRRYVALDRQSHRLRRNIDALRAEGADETLIRDCLAQIKAVVQERRTIPSVDPMDPNFRRLRYCRYADDFLIGVIGSKAEAGEVMASVQAYLAEHLKLTVSLEKSGVQSASKGAPFLGYHVCTWTLPWAGPMVRRVGRDGRTLRVRYRPARGNVRLRVPQDKVTAFCRRKGYGVLAAKKGRQRPQFLDSSDAEIVSAFNSEFRGFANYYAIANGVKPSLGVLELVVFRSLLKTLAMRHQTSAWRMKSLLKMGSDYGVSYVVRGEPHVLKFWRLKHLKQEAWPSPAVDVVTVGSRLAMSRNDLITRLNAGACESCGSTSGPFEVHHVRHLKDMQASPLTLWKRSARLRKTAVLCQPCHVALHAGR